MILSTYRLQLRPGFGFVAARRLAPYLRALGVSHVFASPLLQAAPGSLHGYDVADPTRVSRELGGPAAFRAWVRSLHRLDLGLVVDIVPNHMTTATPANRWWGSVMRHGRRSPWARFFDLDWRHSTGGLRYRRFFDVSSLVGVRVEDPVVFTATHKLVLHWIRRGDVDGLRLDHLDGLRDPAQYLHRLHRAAPRAWIIAEKILTADERLRPAWPLAGTTGYDFLNLALALLVDPRGRRGLLRAYRAFAGPQPGYPDQVRRQRTQVLQDILRPEVARLAGPRRSPATVAALAAACPVYRTYVGPRGPLSPPDRAVLQQIQRRVRARTPALALVRQLLAGRQRNFLLGLQQLTPAVFAKAVEDTVAYRYLPLAALNEVGGSPLRFGLGLAAFHSACRHTQRHWPHTLLTTSTHDTKRGEDVRARLALLAQIPAEWQRVALSWARRTEPYRSPAGPDRNLQYLFFQTLVGAWPISPARMQAYLRKAAREAKQHTSWRHPDRLYETALRRYIHAAMADRPWLAEVNTWLQPLIGAGWINSLTQAALKLTAPGVSGVYNGAELWDLSLVDPDNRRPVNFRLRARLLRELEHGLSPEAIWSRRAQGLPKLWLTRQALHLRRRRPQVFFGPYQPLSARGSQSRRVIAFARSGAVAIVAQRFPLRAPPWRDTRISLPPGSWHNSLTGDQVPGGPALIKDVLRRFPVALLERAA